MMKRTVMTFCGLFAIAGMVAAQATVKVEDPKVEGPRVLEKQTATAVVKDYIESWDRLRGALEQNRPELLDRDFVGGAKDKLIDTIQQQVKAGLKTVYTDRSHDVQIVFYSPEGLSVELTDTVEYEVQVRDDKDKVLSTQPVRARYIVVLTPAEVRWRIRVLQAVSE